MMMLLGRISSRISSGACARRHRFRTAMATAFLAAPCPTMYRSSSATIFLGGSSSSQGSGSGSGTGPAGGPGTRSASDGGVTARGR